MCTRGGTARYTHGPASLQCAGKVSDIEVAPKEVLRTWVIVALVKSGERVTSAQKERGLRLALSALGPRM
jgi:hypothetical protein